ncbi:MAG: oligopeptide/dipeptide ABC transporter ATP-binding protein [Bacteroidia bacterium]
MKELCREQGMGLVLITHDLEVVRRMADHVSVMYAGTLVESGTMNAVFSSPAHPYTQALKQAMPNLLEQTESLLAIPGSPPDLSKRIEGCAFAPRCARAMNVCARRQPEDYGLDAQHAAKCWLYESQRNKLV